MTPLFRLCALLDKLLPGHDYDDVSSAAVSPGAAVRPAGPVDRESCLGPDPAGHLTEADVRRIVRDELEQIFGADLLRNAELQTWGRQLFGPNNPQK
jgi:hypothetical protein